MSWYWKEVLFCFNMPPFFLVITCHFVHVGVVQFYRPVAFHNLEDYFSHIFWNSIRKFHQEGVYTKMWLKLYKKHERSKNYSWLQNHEPFMCVCVCIYIFFAEDPFIYLAIQKVYIPYLYFHELDFLPFDFIKCLSIFSFKAVQKMVVSS